MAEIIWLMKTENRKKEGSEEKKPKKRSTLEKYVKIGESSEKKDKNKTQIKRKLKKKISQEIHGFLKRRNWEF